MPELQPTGERFSPGLHSPDLEHEHMMRYAFACAHVQGKSVLDVACGTGYGTHMLATAGAGKVLGVDISPAAIAHAERTYLHKNLRFLESSALEMTRIDSNSVETVVSFETVEHLDDDEALVRELHRVLEPGGMLLMSTPDRRLESVRFPIRRRPDNPHHVREYTETSFTQLLGGRFEFQCLYGQCFVPSWKAWWPLHAAAKAAGAAIPSESVRRRVRSDYKVGSGFAVQPRDEHPRSVPRFWIAMCTKRE